MNRRSRRLQTAAALLVLAGPSARAGNMTAVHAADQVNLGRIVIDTNGSAIFGLIRAGDHVSVRFNRPVMLGEAPAPP